MKTIEERAKAYAAKCHGQNTEWGFIAGAQSEREELTRWNDPNKPPTDEMRVIVKVVLPNGATLVNRAPAQNMQILERSVEVYAPACREFVDRIPCTRYERCAIG